MPADCEKSAPQVVGIQLPHNDSAPIELCLVRYCRTGRQRARCLLSTRSAANRRKTRSREKRSEGITGRGAQAAQFLHYSGPATEQLALTYGDIGDSEKALQALRDLVAMGQADENLSVAPQLVTLRSRPELKEILKQMDLNKRPIQTAVSVVELHDSQLVPKISTMTPRPRPFL